MKDKILRSLKKYDFKPYYVLRIQAEACHYTVLLNGIPATSLGTRGGLTTEVPLNKFILKSGRQLLTLDLVPFLKGQVLKEPVSFVAEVGFSMAGEGRSLGNYTRIASFSFGPQLKEKGLPVFRTSLPFEAKVPWDYTDVLSTAVPLSPGAATDALLQRALVRLRTAVDARALPQYHALVVDGIAHESDVLYRTPEDVDRLVTELGLSDVQSVPPLPAYHAQLFADNKLVKAVADETDKYGNRPVFTYTIAPLRPGGPAGRVIEDYLYYLPRGASELRIF